MTDVHAPPLTADVALFLDFDGTIVEIAARPDDVRVPDGLGAQLRDVSWGLNGALAVISGRSIATVDHYLGAAVQCVAGIHGAERRTSRGHINHAVLDPSAIQHVRSRLNDFGRAHPNILIEDKGLSVAVHFREAPDLAAACQRLVDACVADSHGRLERQDGKMVTELKPAGITKVDALLHFMNEAPFAGRRPVFVGDDLTDESAFVAVSKTNGFGVIVGDRSPTAATARLSSVTALHHWLQTFCDQQNDSGRKRA